MLSTLIFDLDGTLFDSTEANIKAYSLAFNKVGIDFDVEQYRKLFGLRYKEMIKAIAPSIDEHAIERIKDLKTKYYQENLNLVLPNEGLLDLLRSSSGKFDTALVTTASHNNVMNLLDYFSIDPKLFSIIVTGEDVINGKPDPECYLTALNRLGKSPEECCVFEDSQVGIRAAKLAGIKVIKVAL